MVYGIYDELVTGANLNQLISWGPHIVNQPQYVCYMCDANDPQMVGWSLGLSHL